MRFALPALALFASVTFAACSEPVPQSPDGAFWLHTTQPDSSCAVFGQVATVGTVSQSAKTTVIDGTNSTQVACEVIGDKAPFKAHGKIDDVANSGSFLEISIPSISPTATKDNPAQGSAQFAASWTSGKAYNGNCRFYFESSSEGVGSGRIWVSFECDGLSSSGSTCPVEKGYAIFENCATEDTST